MNEQICTFDTVKSQMDSISFGL